MPTRPISPGGTGRVERPPVPERGIPSPLDRDLTTYREGVRWSFSGGKVLVDGLDVNRLISYNPSDVGHWIGLAEGLDEYRRRVVAAAREVDQFARFAAVIEALLGKIMGRLKRVYDQKMSGLTWSLENGQLILNGINIRSFLALYRIRKTEKAKKFLKGLKGKLTVLLENRQESADYERIREVVEDLHREMGELLEEDAAPRAARRLSPPHP